MKLKTFLLLLIFSLPPIIMADDDKMKETERQISTQIKGLGSEQFEKREESQSQLITLGAEMPDFTINKCLNNYVGCKDPEIRFRLKNVLRILVLKKYYKQKGFIGISMQPGKAPQIGRAHV